MEKTQKTALVTGASRGIGKAAAEKLLREEWKVIGISRNFDRCGIQHENFLSKEIDLENLDSLPENLRELRELAGAVDAIISNAGRGHFGHLEEFSYNQIQSLIHLNFLSHVYIVKAFLPDLKRRRSGDIIFIGSEAALEGKRKGSIYCAGKFALRGFSQALRDECATSGIRVSIINPGLVDTSFFADLNFRPGGEPGERIEPEDVAEAIALVLNSRKGTVFDEINLSPQKGKIIGV